MEDWKDFAAQVRELEAEQLTALERDREPDNLAKGTAQENGRISPPVFNTRILLKLPVFPGLRQPST